MDHTRPVAGVGVPLLVGATTFAFVWEFVGAWLLPWLLLFWFGPTVGLVAWRFER